MMHSCCLAVRRLRRIGKPLPDDRLPDIGYRQGQRHPAGLDLGDVQHALTRESSASAIPEHGPDVLPAAGAREVAGAALEQEFGEPDDGVERGAQLVRHVGEKPP